MTVAELLSRVTSKEMTEWQAYFKLHPFGAQMDNWRSGLIAASIYNSQMGKRGKPKKPEDFIPKSEAQRQHDMYAQIESFTRKMGGVVKRG